MDLGPESEQLRSKTELRPGGNRALEARFGIEFPVFVKRDKRSNRNYVKEEKKNEMMPLNMPMNYPCQLDSFKCSNLPSTPRSMIFLA